MSDPTLSSVDRVRAALRAAGHPDTITEFPAGTRTAADAAAAVGCEIAQIAKSIVFRAGGTESDVLRAGGTESDVMRADGTRAAIIVTSGANRVDPARAAAALGVSLARADADWVRAATGFAVGGVAPIAHTSPPLLLLDADLMALDPIWAAAGSPRHVFRTTAAELRRLTGAATAAIRQV
ncbi:MAG: YbaK/EbsC family protein [Proteobacteria bacterium]|nr:YbaK/EbsC family protein [Pseudomonadota bacterium]